MNKLNDEIHNIIENRLFKASESLKKKFPSSISDGSGFYVTFGNDKLHAIIFLDEAEKGPLLDRKARGYDLFPGLITMDESMGAAFRFENSKYAVIESCKIENSYALLLGKDSSIILVDLYHEVNTAELGVVINKIDLGFIITYPDESITFDIRESFDDLISYYISTRREP